MTRRPATTLAVVPFVVRGALNGTLGSQNSSGATSGTRAEWARMSSLE